MLEMHFLIYKLFSIFDRLCGYIWKCHKTLIIPTLHYILSIIETWRLK